jgi:CYTH domain-containing protein
MQEFKIVAGGLSKKFAVKIARWMNTMSSGVTILGVDMDDGETTAINVSVEDADAYLLIAFVKGVAATVADGTVRLYRREF